MIQMKTFRINPKGKVIWVLLRANNKSKHSKYQGIIIDAGRGWISQKITSISRKIKAQGHLNFSSPQPEYVVLECSSH